MRPVRAAALALPVAFLCLFLLYPLARIIAAGLAPMASSGFAGIAEIARRTGLWTVLGSAAVQALASTALSLLLGLPAAFVFARFDFPLKRLMRTLITLPFVLPTTVAGSAFIALLGSGGAVERIFGVDPGIIRTLPAVLIAHVFFNIAVVVRIVGGYWSGIDPRIQEAAAVLGAGRVKAFFTVTFRLLLPAVSAAGLLVFTYCFTSFGTVLILGGPRMATLETEIYRQAVHLFNLPAAALLSLVQIAFTAVLFLVYARLQSAMRTTLKPAPPELTSRKPRSPGEITAVWTFGYGVTAALMLPPAVLVAGSVLTRNGIGLEYWSGLFVNLRGSLFWTPPFKAVGNSLAFSLTAAAIALAVGIPAAYAFRNHGGRPVSTFLDSLFLLPLGVSSVTLGFGFLIALDAPPLDLRNSLLIMPVAHAMAALPLVTRSLAAPLRSMSPGLREAAAVLGAGRLRSLVEIDFPILRPALISSAAFAFTVSLGEFAATALLTRPELTTIPVAIYGLLGRAGDINRGQAYALSVMLMAVCCAVLTVMERVRMRGSEML